MRKLAKHAAPLILTINAQTWTARYVGSDNPKPVVWRHGELVEALKAETHGKCAYCEGYITDVSFVQVEHIMPKSKFPNLVVEWNNLTIACQACNTAKGDYYEATAPLLNPFLDSPSEHLRFLGPIVEGRPQRPIGQRTVDQIDLSRTELILSRAERIKLIQRLIHYWERENGPDKDIAAQNVRRELVDEREFVETLREYARSYPFPVDA